MKHKDYFSTKVVLKMSINNAYIMNKFIEVSFKMLGINNKYSDSKCMSEQIICEYNLYGGLL